ncbi:MAG: YbjQ family protein [Tagaea sp.]|nr:YbjQ family protein [Tagaea sp.]
MISTTETIEGRRIAAYLGIVASDVVMGSNAIRDFFASVRDWVGGRAGSYEKVLADARREALDELAERAAKMGADAVVGVDIEYQSVGGTMLMVAVNGTAVKLG